MNDGSVLVKESDLVAGIGVLLHQRDRNAFAAQLDRFLNGRMGEE